MKLSKVNTVVIIVSAWLSTQNLSQLRVKFIEKSDPSLPGLEPETRQKIYSAMNRTIAKIHSVDVEKAGLSNYGKVIRTICSLFN